MSLQEPVSSYGDDSNAATVDFGVLPVIKRSVASTEDWRESRWETEAHTILRGFNFHDIQLLCRFRIYRDYDLPRQILRTRWKSTLNAFLLFLDAGKCSREDVADIRIDQEVEVILERLEPPLSDSQAHWYPLMAMSDSAVEIAAGINRASVSSFNKISFSDHVRQALDYPNDAVDSVEGFFFWHDVLLYRLSRYVQRYPSERIKYIQVATMLCNRNPFAHWAVSQSLRAWTNDPVTPRPDLSFIIEPLRTFIEHQDRTLKALLKHLAVLEIRFRRSYIDEEVDWTRRFRTEAPFLELITKITPHELGSSLTDDDQLIFRPLSLESIVNQDCRLQSLNHRWNELFEAVVECAVVESHYIGALAKYLHAVRNFYSLIAVLQGLRESGFDESALPDLFNLITSDCNYVVYRNAFGSAPGLPFLFPHVREYTLCQDKGIPEIFGFVTYRKKVSLPQSNTVKGILPRTNHSKKPDSLDCNEDLRGGLKWWTCFW